MIQFFMRMKPPTVTAQEHKVKFVNGHPVFYDPPELKAARQDFQARLKRHAPAIPLMGPVALYTSWRFPAGKTHMSGTWKTTKPDTDNLQKLLKDCMTVTGFWLDDAQVACEHIEKVWSDDSEVGIFIKVVEM